MKSLTEFFLAKLWTLLHDPPHKVWILKNGKRCLDADTDIESWARQLNLRGHEKEALNIFNKIFPNGKTHNYLNEFLIQLAKEADHYSSSFDRWITQIGFIININHKNIIFEYYNLHNIFSPSNYVIYVKNPDEKVLCDRIKKWVARISGLTNSVDNIELIYHLVYASAELAWIKEDLPPPLAETRVPTHTIFDHLYAAAMTVNWLWEDRQNSKDTSSRPFSLLPKGYYVVVDIPGVSKIVEASRKAGDFWAGSWLVSALMWLTAWSYIKLYGPDILLTPTARFNPFYYEFLRLWLEKENKKQIADKLIQLYEDVIAMAVGAKNGVKLSYLLRHAIIPATITLALPKKENVEKLEEEILQNFNQAYRCIIHGLVLGDERNIECTDEIVKKFIETWKSQIDENILKLVKSILYEIQPHLFEQLLIPRIVIIDMEETYTKLQNIITGQSKETIDNISYETYQKFLKFLKNFKKQKSNSEEIDEDMISKYLLFHVVTKEARRKLINTTKLPVGRTWFELDGQPLMDYQKFTDAPGWIFCTICLREPAVVKFGKAWKVKDSVPVVTYDDETIKRLNIDGNVDELQKIFKPGEALGPLCLLKRLLYLSTTLRPKFDTTEDVAIGWYTRWIYRKISPLLKNTQTRECNVAVKYIEQKRGRDILAYGPIEEIRRLFRKCAESVEKYVDKDTATKISRFYGATQIHSLLELRDTYAVIKADADDIRKVYTGNIPTTPYKQLLIQLADHSDSRDVKEFFTDLLKLLNALEELTNGKILVSPTYYAALSLSLMITALKDIYKVEKIYEGMTVYAGGDDVLALASVDASLHIAETMRRNYWGEGGFHRIGKYAIPAVVVTGRSISVRYANVLDHMGGEISKTLELLKEAKKTTWLLGGREVKKDTLVISDSRTNTSAYLPLIDPRNRVGTYIQYLRKMWGMMIGGELSGNAPSDYIATFGDVTEKLDEQALVKIYEYTLSRNLKKAAAWKYADVAAEAWKDGRTPLGDEIMKALAILRRYP
jgi:CRISPR-associated protein Cmr2